MNRRQYLTRAGAGVTTLAVLAGCLGDLTDSDSSGSGDNRTGERELDRAVGSLNDAALALDLEADIEDPEAVEFDSAEPADSIDDARAHLETAAAELGEDRQPDIETLRTYADILDGLVTVTDTVTDDTLAADVDAVTEAIAGDGDLEAASETLDERTTTLEAARTRYDAVDSDFQGLDDRFESLARIDRTELADGISTLGDVLGSLEALGDGYGSILDGYADLEQGQDDFENEEYKRAKSSFARAESAFESATTTLEGDAETPAGLTSYFETASCQSGHLTDAAAAFADAAAAAEDRDPVTAEQRKNDGEQALEETNDCTAAE